MTGDHDVSHEAKQRFTEQEIKEAVGHALTNQRVDHLERMIAVANDANLRTLAEIRIHIERLTKMISDQHGHIDRCRSELRAEIEKDFASKLDLVQLAAKVDRQWIKITATVTAVIAVAMIVQYFAVLAYYGSKLSGAGA